MDRWSWHSTQKKPAEEVRATLPGIRLYDGDHKTEFDQGSLTITTHRLTWNDGSRMIDLPLKSIHKIDTVAGTFTKSAKLVLHLDAAPHSKEAGPSYRRCENYVKLSFVKGGDQRCLGIIQGCLSEKRWEKGVIAAVNKPASLMGGGLVRIEQQIESSRINTDRSLNSAFKDIDALMSKAKDMVVLADRIAQKLSDTKNENDETTQLKSALLSIGISNPVTRSTHGTGTAYHKSLGLELSRMLQKPLADCGGVMNVSEVYCRYNRARGLQLISPEDVVNACRTLTPENHGMELKKFSSGVLVIEAGNFKSLIEVLLQTIDEHTCVSAVTLGNITSIPIMLAKERLMAAEEHGYICRDETSDGVLFYRNMFCEIC